MGITHYPVCIAKTQYSFSADPKIYGAVNNFEFHIKDIVINNGAEMIVAIAGEILRMPGLPKEPQALHIDIVDGEIEGLSLIFTISFSIFLYCQSSNINPRLSTSDSLGRRG